MDIFVMYLKGLGVITVIVLWGVVFNIIWKKITGEWLSSSNPIATIIFPFLFPPIIAILLAVPLIIGSLL